MRMQSYKRNKNRYKRAKKSNSDISNKKILLKYLKVIIIFCTCVIQKNHLNIIYWYKESTLFSNYMTKIV